MKTQTLRKIYDWSRVILGTMILTLGMIFFLAVPLLLPDNTPAMYAWLIFAVFIGISALGVKIALQPAYERDAVLRGKMLKRIVRCERVLGGILFAEANFYGVPVIQELNIKQLEQKGALA